MRMMVSAIVLCVGCISSGATQVGSGMYIVNAKGGAFVSQGDVLARAYQEANTACPGGYDVGSGTDDTRATYLRTAYGVQQLNSHEISLVVQCRDPEPLRSIPRAAEAPPPEPPRSVPQHAEAPPPPEQSAPGEPHWWCATANNGATGLCDRRADVCEARRLDMENRGFPHSACEPMAVVSCFRAAMANGQGSMCYPTQALCLAARDFARSSPDVVVLGECDVTQ